MNKNILYILLLSYTAMLCKPVLPYVIDVVEHVLLYDQHVAEVHIENGKMHVHQEAVDAGADQSDDQPSTTVKKISSNWDHISPSTVYFLHPIPSQTNYNDRLKVTPKEITTFTDYPPPRLYFI